jgi:hypothetical protein
MSILARVGSPETLPFVDAGVASTQVDGALRPPARWNISSPSFAPIESIESDQLQETLASFHDGQVVFEFDVMGCKQGQVDISWIGRPDHWTEDTYSEEDRRKQLSLGFMAVLQTVFSERSDTQRVVISSDNRNIMRTIIGCGRPAGVNMYFNTSGDKTRTDVENVPTMDFSSALKWVDNGQYVEIIYETLLQSV